MLEGSRGLIGRVAEQHEHHGFQGVAGAALNRLHVRLGSIEVVHVLLLTPEAMRPAPIDACFESRFLSPEEIARFAGAPANHLSVDFAERARRGLDLCYGVIHGDRLASYGWYALHSVEPEHGAGSALALPANAAYMYKGFTHPDYRGQRLYGAGMARAFSALQGQEVDRLVAFVRWSNAASLSSCERLGYRRLGLLVVGPSGPIHVPGAARRLGIRFGKEANAALDRRTVLATTFSSTGRDVHRRPAVS
jgi:L-amino acid N-acyltransferase YncA